MEKQTGDHMIVLAFVLMVTAQNADRFAIGEQSIVRQSHLR
jgi:hypothetical protein